MIMSIANESDCALTNRTKQYRLTDVVCQTVERHLEACGFTQVRVSIEGGAMILRGWVDSGFEQHLASSYTRRLTGVALIDNQISVRPQPVKKSLQLIDAGFDWLTGTHIPLVGEVWKLFVWGTAILALLVLSLPEQSAEPRISAHSVAGEVILEAHPPVGAMVIFHPVAHKVPEGHVGVGTIGRDGTFKAQIFRDQPGLPIGEYVLTVHDLGFSGEDRTSRLRTAIPSRYSNAETSPLRIIVREGENQLTSQVLYKKSERKE
jgi:hypothetical protein